MSFEIFEDLPVASLQPPSESSDVLAKPGIRQFGTVLHNANRDLQQNFVNVPSQTAKWGNNVVETVASSPDKSYVDSEISYEDCGDISAPFPSTVSLNDDTDACASTSLLLSADGYFDEIGVYLHQMEAKYQCKPNYMSKQRDLSHPMRSVLIDWLVEVADEYKLQRRTLFLAVAAMDRFLSEMSVLRSKLQLLGATCLFIAAKFEEIYPPEAAEFAYLTEDTYSVSQILKLERLVLRVLDYQVASPTTDVMCDRIIAAAHLSKEQASLINYLSELSLVYGDPFLQYLPSVIASACVCLSNICMEQADPDLWPEELERLTGKQTQDFYYCLVLLSDVMHQAPANANCKSVVARYQNVVNCLPDRDRIAALHSTPTCSRDLFVVKS